MAVLIQAFGIIGIIFNIFTFQCKKHKPLLLLKTGNELFFAFQYLLLGAYTGMAMNLVGCVRNVIFTGMVERGKKTGVMQVVFSVLFLIFSALTWVGFHSLLSGSAKVLSTIAYGNKNTAFVRCIILFTSCCWLCYNYVIRSYAGCICELSTMISIIIAIIRIDLPARRQAE